MSNTEELIMETRVTRRSAGTAHHRVEAEICVLGAGIAGISAAIEAARLGRRVILADGLPVLGGQAGNGAIGGICGLFSNGAKPYQLTHGIADEILRDLGAKGAIHFRQTTRGSTWTTVMYDDLSMSRWIEEAVRQAGIQVVLGATLCGVTREGRAIREVRMATRFGYIDIAAQGFVDATGDAALAWQAGLPCREPADHPIYGSQMFFIQGVVEDRWPTIPEVVERLQHKAETYGLVYKDGFTHVFPGKGMAVVNMTHVETPLDPIAFSRNTLEGKAQADRVLRFLQSEFPETFSQARIFHYGLLGVRQTRWIVGTRQLTLTDVRAGTRFPDAVARTAWAVDLHSREDRYLWEPFDDDHIHYVPLGSMVSPEADNLVAAGRCIDGDPAALSSVRVMGPCIAMGAAAAHTLDLALAGAGSVHAIDVASLQERLKDNLDRRD